MVVFTKFIEKINNNDLMGENKFKHTNTEGKSELYTDDLGTTLVLTKWGVNFFFNTVYTLDPKEYSPGRHQTYMSRVFLSLGSTLMAIPDITEGDMSTVLNLLIDRVTKSKTSQPIRWKGYEFTMKPTKGLMIVSVKMLDTSKDFWYTLSREVV